VKKRDWRVARLVKITGELDKLIEQIQKSPEGVEYSSIVESFHNLSDSLPYVDNKATRDVVQYLGDFMSVISDDKSKILNFLPPENIESLKQRAKEIEKECVKRLESGKRPTKSSSAAGILKSLGGETKKWVGKLGKGAGVKEGAEAFRKKAKSVKRSVGKLGKRIGVKGGAEAFRKKAKSVKRSVGKRLGSTRKVDSSSGTKKKVTSSE